MEDLVSGFPGSRIRDMLVKNSDTQLLVGTFGFNSIFRLGYARICLSETLEQFVLSRCISYTCALYTAIISCPIPGRSRSIRERNLV